MKQLHFYKVVYELCGTPTQYIDDWANWTGEVPQKGDVVILHFVDDNDEESRYKVVGRSIDGTKPDDVTLFIEPL